MKNTDPKPAAIPFNKNLSPFKGAMRAAYADNQGLIIACNRAYRTAASAGDTALAEALQTHLWRLLRTAGYVK